MEGEEEQIKKKGGLATGCPTPLPPHLSLHLTWMVMKNTEILRNGNDHICLTFIIRTSSHISPFKS